MRNLLAPIILWDLAGESEGAIHIYEGHGLLNETLRQRCKTEVLQASRVGNHLLTSAQRLVATDPTIFLKPQGLSMSKKIVLPSTILPVDGSKTA